MSTLVSTLHVGCVNGKPLRLYRSPTPGMHLPWQAWEDLHHCLDLDEDMRGYMRRSLMADWSRDVSTVLTAEGIVTIAPQWMAAGVVAATRIYAKVIDGGVEPAALLRAVKVMAAEMQCKGKVGTELIPMGATWFNQGRFERFTDAASGGSGSAEANVAVRLAKITDAEWRTRMNFWKSRCGHWPWGNLTPAPNDPRTKVSAHILAEFNIVHRSNDSEQMRAVS